jgi:hypothetical protein
LWQDDALAKLQERLGSPECRGKVVILTVDMKSKTVKDKNRCEQGHGMGAKGMSLHGGMVDGYRDGVFHTHYIDVIYEQSSNQSLEEAMVGIRVQVEEIRRTWPDVREIWIQSDKCGNFNSFDQIPWIVKGNQSGWGGEPGKLLVTDWTFTESQTGKDRLDCHFSYIR